MTQQVQTEVIGDSTESKSTKTSRSLSWKYIPMLFAIWLSIQVAVFFYVREALPEFKEVGFPTNFESAQKFSQIMSNYLDSQYYTLFLFVVSNFVFLQTWCIPGTFVFNLLAGALFGIKLGFPICIACNTLGAVLCFTISKYFAKEIIQRRMPNQLAKITQKVEDHKKDLFFFLLSTRLFPGSPNWLMNISFPHIGITIGHFIGSISIGLLPWNFLTCQAGSIIHSFKSKSDIFQPHTYLMLFGFALCLLIPPLIRVFTSKKQKSV